MPTIPLRRKLLDNLDDIDCSFKRARLERYLLDLCDDLSTLGYESSSSMSSISSLSTVSSLSSDDSDSCSDKSNDSLSLSELEDLQYTFLRGELDALWEDIRSTRVLFPHPTIEKSAQIHLLDSWRDDNLDQYRRKVRVDPATFDGILSKIEGHDIFYNNSNVPQAPVKTQLTIFLNRAGHYGNAASPEHIGQWAGVSVGTVVNCTNRVMIALLALHDEAIHLPTAEEKEAAKAWVGAQVCPEWRDGFLMVDGTKFSLFQRPGLHGDAWFDKNKDYSLDCQLVILPDSLLVADYALGHTGSVHDSWAFRSTRTFKEHAQIFTPAEWMWADSAYLAETWCVSPFKKPIGRELSRNQRTFNYHVSKVRIRSEHAFGLLKGRFQALRELRIQIRSSKQHRWAIMFVRCCIILHNIIIRLEDGDIDMGF